jgi:flagellin-like protein
MTVSRQTPTGRPPNRRRLRAVSPVIATILLVAIVVVLAAVLYVVVGGLARTSVKDPLGSELYVGPAAQVIGTARTSTFCQSGHFCYSIPIDEVGQGISFGDVSFEVRSPSGSVHVVTQNFAQLSIVNDKNGVDAYSKVAKNGAFEVTGWQKFGAGTTASTPLSNLQTIWLQFGNTKASPFGQGNSVEVLGEGPFSGSMTVGLP